MKLLILGNDDYIVLPDVMQGVVEEVENKMQKKAEEIVVRKVAKGEMNGIDHSAISWAMDKNKNLKSFYKNYVTMAEYSDACLAIWDGKCSKCRKAIEIMEKMGKPVYHKLILNNDDKE